jgi:eukaryotic-like serine/threonine-protein kinase
MLVHPDGRVMLGDFGIARPLHLPDQTTQLAPELADNQSKASLTQAGTALGTPDYMAPEQVQLETLSPATDVYALGIATYELLGGKTPFEGGDVPAVLQSHVTLPPPPLRALRPELPRQVEEVIFWALAKDPADRPATAGQFAKALRATLMTEPPDSGNSWSLHSAPSLGLIAAVERQENGGLQRVLSEGTLPLHRSAALESATTLPPVAGAVGHRRVKLLPLPARLQQPSRLLAATLALAVTVAALGTGFLILRAASAGKPSAPSSGPPAVLTIATTTTTTVPTATNATVQPTTAAQATATATTVQPTAAPPPTATVPVPSPSPTLMIAPTPLVLQPSPQNPNNCVATQTITNTTGQTVGWQWQQPQQGGFHFQINGGPMMDWPKDLQPGIPPHGTDTLTAMGNCQPQPKDSGILLTDTLGDQYTFVLQLQ